ncbi:MAG: aminotransferase class I/II-fold pyridoxal phosphate-dependent enzyme [Pseudomonadota bacterium]
MTLTLAARMGRIKPSPTTAASARASALIAQGQDILALTTGEPDFDTPSHIQEAALEAMRAGQTRYTAVDGTVALKTAIQAKFARENNLNYALNQIIAGTGAKQVIFNALMATIGAGDEVIIPTPSWVSYPDIVKLAGGTPVFVECPAADGFMPTAATLAPLITPRTKAIMLNAPGNPSGGLFSRDELQALGEMLADRPDILVITDDIYEHIRFTDAPFLTLAEVCPELKEQVLTVNGVSKSFAMTGWRIGYGAGPAPLIAAMKTLQGQSTTNPNAIAQAAAVAALNGPLDCVEMQRQAFQRRRDAAVAHLSKVEGLEVTSPQGAFYLFLGLHGVIGKTTPQGDTLHSDGDVVEYLLTQGGVALVAGAGFGLSPYMRLSFALADDALAEACLRIERALADLS